MKIGIEAQRLFREKKHGMDMVALELIKQLQVMDTENEYFIFVKPDKDSTCLHETSNFHIIELTGRSYPYWEQFVLPKAARKYGCNVLHCTANTAPLHCSMPLVITLHDIIYLEKHPLLLKSGNSYQKLGNLYRRWNVPKVVAKAAKIISVSEFESIRIQDYFNLKSDKVTFLYNGVGAHFKPITDKSQLESIKSKYRLPDKFMFFLGNTDPKKNTRNVLKAFSFFKEKSVNPYKLVMLDFDEVVLLKMLNEINKPQLRDEILLTGYIKNADLPSIYSLCSLFLYPSLRESFGIPILEAMGCGIPVITSKTSSMPEVAGDAALLINPEKPSEISAAMIDLLGNENFRNLLIEKGLKRASEFSWKNAALAMKKIYLTFSKNA